VILLDTDVLAIYHLFTHDQRYGATETFMKITGDQARGTTLYNLMELAGIVSAAGKAAAAKKILETYARAADMKILYPALALQTPELFWVEYCAQVMAVMERGLRYGDAKILWVAESHDCTTLVTWNTAHYQDRTPLQIMTPDEYCSNKKSR
jgi:predicted nucleic acid-binding protein